MKKGLFILGVLLLAQLVYAWEDCPRGLDDCQNPCGLYTDTDRDGICDHSQPAPELRKPAQDSAQNTGSSETSNKDRKGYHLLPISLAILMLYGATHLLVRKKVITLVAHRKLWNLLLLLTFLASGLLGILLVIRINTGFSVNMGINQLYWHVEAGIAMAVIALLHIVWHWRYFKAMLGR